MATMAKEPPKNRNVNYIPVPRRSLWRRIWRFMMRTGALLFVDADIHGRGNFPQEGPAIVVANHTAFLEIAMLVGYAPYQLEFLTTGDIPLEPRFAIWAEFYGFIPVKRGSMDRAAMQKALSVLEQGGVICLFPQGGIWDTKVTQARTGVAWLSQKGNAPVVPIGFGGTEGSFAKAVKLQRPYIRMNVGEIVPPCPDKMEGLSRKETLEDYTGQIMQVVFDLIPDWEKERWHSVADEQFDLKIEFVGASGFSPNGDAPEVEHKMAVSKFFHRPVLLDAMRRNLELPVEALEQLSTLRDPKAFADALDVVIHYVTEENPYFLTYRFGNDEGHEMQKGLAELRDAARWSAAHEMEMNIMPVRRFRMDNETDYTEQNYPNEVVEL